MTLYQWGDIARYADEKGDYTSKPRPVVIVQDTDHVEGMKSIAALPITSVLSTASVRVRLKADYTHRT